MRSALRVSARGFCEGGAATAGDGAQLSQLGRPVLCKRHDKYRRQLHERGITPEIARRQTEHGSGLGRVGWVVERTFAWLHNFKRVLVRYDRRAEIHEASLAIGCCLVCYRRLASL